MGMGQNLVPLVNIKIAGKWMFIPLKMVLIGIDPYPYVDVYMYIKYMCVCVYMCVYICITAKWYCMELGVDL